MSSFRSELKDNVLVLSFRAPQAGNSFSLEDSRELVALLKKYKTAKGLILISENPRLFCSGGRLSDYAKLKAKSEGLLINDQITRNLDVLAKWPGLKMVLVNGDCYGGGMEWISCFDFRWAIPTALFSFWQRRIGLTPGWGGGKRWSRILSEGSVHSQLMAAEVFGAGEALRRGVVDRVVRDEKILSEAVAWLSRVVNRSDVIPSKWTAATEKKVFSELWWSAAHREILKSWK
jgi:enoyl-CoA hydratase